MMQPDASSGLDRFLVKDTVSAAGDIQRWAAEGIAYLSLDADVKEFAINDDGVVKAIHRVCMAGGKNMLFSHRGGLSPRLSFSCWLACF